MDVGITKYTKGTGLAWDNAQKILKCCGIDSSKDWNKNLPVPDSCCKSQDSCERDNGGDNFYADGCLKKFKKFIVDNWEISIGIGVGVVVLLLINVVISCRLGKRMGR